MEFKAPQTTSPTPEGADVLIEGWTTFANGWLLLDMTLILLLAMLLGAVIAYHPSDRRKVTSLDHYEQPKTFIMYAMVAAVVALIVKAQPTMAFVIFGIGGLLRFRTMVGESKDTGRVILVTMVGLACGLKIFIVAIPATVIGWLVIYMLEQQNAGTIRISGTGESVLHDATKAYRAAIAESGFTIIGEHTKFIKREFLFVVKGAPGLGREALEKRFEDIPRELQGVVDWDRL